MAYGPRKKKISQFTAGSTLTDDTKYSSLQDGINKTFTQEQLIADFADVYGASLRTFEFESDLVVSDIQIDEYCIVEENRYTLYKITSAAANLPNIGLDSGFTAERVRILQQASPSTYAEILAENPDLYAEDDVIYLSGDGIAGDFKVVASAISASSTGVQLSNATWNAAGKHLARVYSGIAKAAWYGVTDDSLLSTDQATEMQAAIDAHQLIDIESNRIAVSALAITSSCKIFSSTREGIIRVTTDTNDRENSPISFNGCAIAELSGFELQGASGDTTGSAQTLVNFIDCGSVTVEDMVKVTTPGGYTFYPENCDKVLFNKNKNMTRGTIWLGGTELGLDDCNDITIVGNGFYSSQYDSIKAVGKNIKIANNTFNGGDNDAIDCYTSGRQVVIINNYFSGHTDFGIQCKTVLRDSPYTGGSSDQDGHNRYVIITGNTFDEETAYGVAIKHDDLRASPSEDRTEYPWSYLVTSNNFKECPRGVYLKQVSGITVSANDFFECSDTAILVSNWGYDVIIKGNNIRQAAGVGTGINVQGTGSTEAFDISVEGNQIYLGAAGIVCRGDYLTVANNRVRGVTGIGIQMNFCSLYNFSNNAVRACGTGISINEFGNSVISGNSAMSCTAGWSLVTTTAGQSAGATVFGNVSASNGSDTVTLNDDTNFEEGINNFTIVTP